MWDVKPGDKVTLIAPMTNKRPESIRPEFGKVYTVRETLIAYGGNVHAPGIRLVEIINTPRPYLTGPGSKEVTEVSFALKLFRPVTSHKGMEVLRAILNDPLSLKRMSNPLDKRKVKVVHD